MKLSLIAIGRLKAGPERELVERYRERVSASGRALGLTGLDIAEIPESRARREEDRRAEEAQAILARAGDTPLALFDERGERPTSAEFAGMIARERDSGLPGLAFVIGGPDGLDQSLRARAKAVISFGSLTMPHQIVRALVAEQIYRALTIMSGHPYHRAGKIGG
ncbi:MAG: 23S rRNA (pseudouridine(1915)-N(3))-methyltransferase RlmH [Salinarimonadaceae bacterium]|nr:MAG: 23S rRNA (pseudouridine(1915)-N(3))-methyltransferase RlmH [Salinarimonadaceae bacterium]